MAIREIFDQWGGVVQEVHVNDGNLTFRDTQDAQPILDDNKRRVTSGNYYLGSGDQKYAKHVAHIPNITFINWLKDDNLTYRQFYSRDKEWRTRWFRKKIYDKDNQHLLTSPHSNSSRPIINAGKDS